MKQLSELTQQEILALAISLEEEHGRIYADYAQGLKEQFPASAKVFEEMAAEENEHRRWLIDLHREKFGEHIPLLAWANGWRLVACSPGTRWAE